MFPNFLIPSIIAISISLPSLKCCKPSSLIRILQLVFSIKNFAALTLFDPITTGQLVFLCIINGSSPTSMGLEDEFIKIGLLFDNPLYPLETIPGKYPSFLSSFANQITKGVFPVPPTVKFPMTMVLKSGFHAELKFLFLKTLNKNLYSQDMGKRIFIHDLF